MVQSARHTANVFDRKRTMYALSLVLGVTLFPLLAFSQAEVGDDQQQDESQVEDSNQSPTDTPPTDTPPTDTPPTDTPPTDTPPTDTPPTDTPPTDTPPTDTPSGSNSAPATNTAPWMRSQSDSPYAPERVGTPQELLSYYSIDASHLTRFFDGRPLDLDEDEVLFKILFRISKIQLYKIHQWIDRSPDWDAVMANSDKSRGNFYLAKGRAKRVEAVKLIAADAENYEFATYYKLYFDMDDSPHRGVACLREIPKHWTPGEELDEPIQLSGMYLKTGAKAEEGRGTEFAFAANRVNWLPEQLNSDWGIREQHVKLAALGMDFGLFESVKDRSRLRAGESECFFQLLKTCNAIDVTTWKPERFELEEALVSPDDMRGRLFTFAGTARRVNRIEVDDRRANNGERLGFDHYYQVDIFVPLGEREIKLGKDPNAPVIKNRYFVPVCCTTLPPELEKAHKELKNDDRLDVEVKITGVYYKLWGYRNELMRSFDDRQLQIAPMLMAVEAEVVEYKFERDPFSGLIIGVAFLVVLGSIWFGMWRYSKTDRAQKDLAKDQMAPKKSLNDLGIDVSGDPDFSKLD